MGRRGIQFHHQAVEFFHIGLRDCGCPLRAVIGDSDVQDPALSVLGDLCVLFQTASRLLHMLDAIYRFQIELVDNSVFHCFAAQNANK